MIIIIFLHFTTHVGIFLLLDLVKHFGYGDKEKIITQAIS